MLTAVLIDQREPDWIKRFTFGNALVVTTLLEHGDFQITCDDGAVVLVERKTASDLLASIADGRLFAQASGMIQASRWSYLLITGEITPTRDGKTIADGIPTGWNFASVQGALLSVQEMGVFAVWCGGNTQVESTITQIANRSRNEQTVIAPARAPVTLSSGEAALIALPGIGLDRMDALMQHAGTPAQALEFLTDITTNGIAGIGPQTKSKVRKALGLVGDEKLTVTKGIS